MILITNDDGFAATGIQELAKAVSHLGDVYVVAPDGGRSGVACAISSNTPVRYEPLTRLPSSPLIHWFACTGTPVDCVKLALERILPRHPDLILSGINHGDNASISVHYSGTMGAVLEGCMKGIPSIGVSLYLRRGEKYEDHAVPEATLGEIGKICEKVLQQGLPQGVCLNINIPQSDTFRGWRVCRQTHGQWTAEWLPDGERTFQLTGTFTDLEPDAPDTDFAALRAGYCSIVPVRIDMTAHEAIDHISKLIS